MKEKTTDNRRLAKKRLQCLNEALCSVSRFSAGRQFSASKSASSPSAKPLGVIVAEPQNRPQNWQL